MKKLIVLSAVLFATLNLTSCDKKAETAPEGEVATEVVTETVDTLAPAEAAPVEGATTTVAATTTTVK